MIDSIPAASDVHNQGHPLWSAQGGAEVRRAATEAIGIREATLTHHLNAMETDGLLTRRRDPVNRRIHRVELTDRGEAMFHQLRGAAIAFDRRLRKGITQKELAELQDLLERLEANS